MVTANAVASAAQEAKDRVRHNLPNSGEQTAGGNASRKRRKRAAANAEDQNARDDDGRIYISSKIADVIDQAQAALLAVGGIYVRGRYLTHVVRDFSAPQWLQLPEGLPLIDALGDARLREMMSSSAQWWKFDARSESYKPALPPEWAAKTLKERGQWPFPILEGISDTPVLRPDGTIHDQPGYDERSRTIYVPGSTKWPAIKHEPTQHDAVTALAELCDPFCDFPFVEPWDKTAAIAFLLSIIGRGAIAGPVPMFKSGSNTPGAGRVSSLTRCRSSRPVASRRRWRRLVMTTRPGSGCCRSPSPHRRCSRSTTWRACSVPRPWPWCSPPGRSPIACSASPRTSRSRFAPCWR
jgi:hypothetical protein